MNSSIVLVTLLLFSAIIMVESIAVQPAFALSRFFNCMTEIANNHGQLSISDVDNCYQKEFHG